MNNINDTIEIIKKLILDPNCSRMNLSNVKGYLGELLVKAKLEGEGIEVTHLGNQSGYDLEFNYKEKIFKIDVKFSTLKSEFHPQQSNWGWALVHQNKKRTVSCTHFVCVAVDRELEIIGYYVIPQSHAESFLSGVGRFKGVKHGFLLFENKNYIPNSRDNFFQLYENSKQLLDAEIAVFVRKDDSLLNAL